MTTRPQDCKTALPKHQKPYFTTLLTFTHTTQETKQIDLGGESNYADVQCPLKVGILVHLRMQYLSFMCARVVS